MANGLRDPVFQIFPNKIDGIRRSPDPAGLFGTLQFTQGHLQVRGKVIALRAARLVVGIGHLTITGKTVRLNRTRPITHGSLTLHGRSIQFANVQWATVPDLYVDVSTPPAFPKYIPNIRVNWLIDPGALVPAANISLQNVDFSGVSYDSGNDRIQFLSNPGATFDVVQLRAITTGGATILSGNFSLIGKAMATYPLAGVALTDASGNPTGQYGGNSDPEGVFFGMSGFASADKWWAENVPPGATVTPLVGGSFTLQIQLGMAVGVYQFDVVRYTPASGATVRTMKSFTVT